MTSTSTSSAMVSAPILELSQAPCNRFTGILHTQCLPSAALVHAAISLVSKDISGGDYADPRLCPTCQHLCTEP